MLGRGKRSASDKKSDKKNEKSDKAAKAEEAARAAELAEEAAAKAREAARLAQQAAEEAAAAEDDEAGTGDPENAVKSPEKPAPSEKDSEDAPAPEGAAEEASASEKADADADAEGEPDEGDDTKPARTKLTKKLPKDEADDEADDDAEEAEEDGDDDDEPRRSRRGGLTTVIAVLAVLTVALGAGTTALYLKVSDQKATEEASKDASFASSRAAQKLSSYDFQTLDTDLKSASALTTGKLHTDYEKLAQELKTVAVQQQAVSNTTVMKVGVVSATPDKVVTLVYANRSSRTKADKQQRLPEPLRIKMTMVKKDGKWLASDLKVIS
jgi:Mce-associated membrane protein